MNGVVNMVGVLVKNKEVIIYYAVRIYEGSTHDNLKSVL